MQITGSLGAGSLTMTPGKNMRPRFPFDATYTSPMQDDDELPVKTKS